MVVMRNICNVLVGKPEKTAYLDDLGTGGRILKCLQRESIPWYRSNQTGNTCSPETFENFYQATYCHTPRQ
jgi:hypothetical protein